MQSEMDDVAEGLFEQHSGLIPIEFAQWLEARQERDEREEGARD